ncbi:hypothetical protein CDL15_Pgr009109 [Punica granatum]|uniref:Poly(A) polymerase I n=1 Tax=Punica granatum TaxID=22663 RepID=A0A218VZ31_PUNGR|nr:hypothetical protein CDL15_Pgr009109 [Punica granatum]
MGCANSKLGREGSTEVMPSRLGPILRNRLENIRRRRRVADAMTLKESTLSTKELLEDAAAPDSSEDTSSRRSTSKPDREDEDHRHSLPFFPCNDRIPPEEKELKEKGRDEEGGRGTHQPKECTMKSEDIDDERKMQKLREEKMIEAVTAAIEQVAMQEVINEEDREKLDENDEHKDDDNDESKMRIPSKSDDYICPGSPSFRVYCVASVSADDSDNDTDECGDINDAPKITSKSEDSSEIRESVNSNEFRYQSIVAVPALDAQVTSTTAHSSLHRHFSPAAAGVVDDASDEQQQGEAPSKLSSRALGIRSSMISNPTRKVLDGLKRKGYEVYLVGGCVRDLILRRTPKDFDIITSAQLKEVVRAFSWCVIVGKRFPICHVHIDNTIVEVQTVIPAGESFGEDCARILRAIRIAGRLGFRISRETAYCIRTLSSKVLRLDKGRLLMELNYMLAYGSAEASLRLLWKYGVLDILLPFQAAYFVQSEFKRRDKGSNMLLSLFSKLDELLAPNRPCHSMLWVGILAFHKALFDKPRHPLAVAAFSLTINNSGDIVEALQISRTISTPHCPRFQELLQLQEQWDSDPEALRDEVMNLAASVKEVLSNMTDQYFVSQALAGYPGAPCSNLVFIHQDLYIRACRMFQCVTRGPEDGFTAKQGGINYEELAQGNLQDVRHTFARVVFDTVYPLDRSLVR